LYRDPDTDLWQRIPWDMDATFSTGNANENFASPLYGDSEHTQAPNQKIYQNFLLDAILDHKPTRQMYLRRLRTLIDTYLTEEQVYFNAEIDRRLERIREEAIADSIEWRTGRIDNGARAIKETALPQRRRELVETFGKDLVPDPATSGLKLVIGEVDPAPEDGSAEYFQVINPNREAMDLSGWTVAGAVRFEFPPGTVIPRRGSVFSPEDGFMFVVRDVRSFRNRTSWPRGGSGLFFVGPYEGKLSSRGETIQIYDRAGQLVVEHTYEGTAITYEAWAADRFSEEELQQEDVSGWSADPNGTGLSNLHRYAFGDTLRFELESREGLSYYRASNTSDLVYALESSPDLITWAEETNLSEQVEEMEDGIEKNSVTLSDGEKRFYRIRVRLQTNR
ncbi:MAG: lamin tail domain-containing protein, partial [Verrucomicrobiota bacterium]